jgi:hypothetical protein
MQQTFMKRIQGHELQFNRLMYPVRYNILVKSEDAQGVKVTAQKDEKGMWNIDDDNTPYWIPEISTEIHETIAQNELLAV